MFYFNKEIFDKKMSVSNVNLVKVGMIFVILFSVQTLSYADTVAIEHFEKAKNIYHSAPGDGEMGPEVLAAISELEKAIKLDPNYVDAYLLLGKLYNKKRFAYKSSSADHEIWRKQAEKQYRKATELAPFNPEALDRLSTILKVGNPEQIDIYKRIIAIDPSYPGAHLGYARHLESIGDLNRAITEYRLYIDLKTQNNEYINPYIFFNVSNLLANQGREDEAVDVLNIYIESDNTHTVAAQLNQVDLSRFNDRKYKEFITKVNNFKNYSDRTNIDEAYKLLEADKLVEAMNKFEQQIRINPYAARHYREFALALEKGKYYKEAYYVYEKLVDSDSRVSDKCWYLSLNGNMVIQEKFLGQDSELPDKLKNVCSTNITLVE